MKYAKIIPNDFVNGKGISVSIWMQGCPHKCKGCHNPELWDFDSGIEEHDIDFLNKLESYIKDNDIIRNVSILGGEPLCEENIINTAKIINFIKSNFKESKIFLWTGYYLNELPIDEFPYTLLKEVDVIIDGPYEEDKRNISLELRGSTNQRVLRKNIDF